ncbi:MAG TPA: Ig-like domain-containing protein [Gemmatimonadaceae bacterium]|nr:Ig-like domain-containing protein [Gemmatimonadaceae bacterium]
MNTMLRQLLAAACGVLLTAALACGSGGGGTGNVGPTPPPTPTPVLTTITVSLSVAQIQVGQTANATASAADQNGAPIAAGTVTWSSSNTNVATITASGAITAVGPGTTQIIATASGKSGQATLTVVAAPAPVASISVSPPTVTLIIGATQQMTATTVDANGNVLTGRAVSWSSSDPTKATVTPTGLVQAIAAGTATIIATSENKSGSAAVTVASSTPAPACSPSTAIKLAAGDVRPLTPTEAASLCVGGLAATSEYVLIPFNHSNVASSTTQIELASTGTGAVTASPALSPIGGPRLNLLPSRALSFNQRFETAFRQRERSDVSGAFSRARFRLAPGVRSQITGVPAVPTVGAIYQLNANLNGNTCSDPKVLHPARVVAVTQHSIVFLDTLSPAGGFTDGELTAFAQAFDTVGFPLDTTNFGANTDIDNNGRVAIFFTPGINKIPQPAGGVIGGLFAARDLFPASSQGCPASNEGEMFYMPVPDPNSTINGNYTSETNVASLVEPTLVHEFQHLINAGRRIYVNNASALEEVWLNEGLSHIAEELLYYRMSGNAPLQNIDLARLQSSNTQVNAFNTDQSQNFARLRTFLQAPSANSPYAEIDGLEMRGAIWSLLRYAADQKGGDQRSTWFALVNSTTNGQANFDAVLGDIVTNTRNWEVSLFVDDMGVAEPKQYTDPSWNYRSVYSGIGSGKFPIATQALVAGTNVQLTVDGGGAAYVRFSVASGVAATVAATSQGQAVPPNVDFILVRTK